MGRLIDVNFRGETWRVEIDKATVNQLNHLTRIKWHFYGVHHAGEKVLCITQQEEVEVLRQIFQHHRRTWHAVDSSLIANGTVAIVTGTAHQATHKPKLALMPMPFDRRRTF